MRAIYPWAAAAFKSGNLAITKEKAPGCRGFEISNCAAG
jgi:hypothetical protein